MCELMVARVVLEPSGLVTLQVIALLPGWVGGKGRGCLVHLQGAQLLQVKVMALARRVMVSVMALKVLGGDLQVGVIRCHCGDDLDSAQPVGGEDVPVVGLMVARVVLEPSGLVTLQVIAPLPEWVAAKSWWRSPPGCHAGPVKVRVLAMRIKRMARGGPPVRYRLPRWDESGPPRWRSHQLWG